tara:strand:+ start:30896 stop:31843 length:948 start_codon:yes stop_codon:yes gene_type:complete
MQKIKFIDLFAGTGGFTEALSSANFECVYTNDMIKESKEIYGLNHPNDYYELKDINTVDIKAIPKFDMICGGFPCQPFSIAGKRKGFNDERSNVFWTLLKIIKYHKPKIILFENVKNMKTHDKGNTYKIIKNNLEKLGYHIKEQILDTSKLTGIPHHRERIYIIGFIDKEKYNNFNFDFPNKKNKDISKFLDDKIDSIFYYNDKSKIYSKLKESVTKSIFENVVYQYRRYYVRENKSSICPTLTANMGTGGHNVPIILDENGIRKLTPRECFNLQGFRKTYKLPKVSNSKLYKLAGNAISVPIVKLIGNNIISLF